MYSEHAGRDFVQHAQRAILRIRDVRSCRVVTDESGAVSEVHVIAIGDRQPKMIARDVVALLKVELDLDVDYRKVGVVLMDHGPGEEVPPAHEIPAGETAAAGDSVVPPRAAAAGDSVVPPRAAEADDAFGPPRAAEVDDAFAPPRPAAAGDAMREPRAAPAGETAPVSSVDEAGLKIIEDYSRTCYRGFKVEIDRDSVKAEVTLSRDGFEATGSSEGERGGPVYASIARAAVRALSELLDENFRLCLSEIREIELAGRKAFVAVVDVVGGREAGSFSGCAFAGADPNEAAVLAVLDAINRPFGRWNSRREIHYRIK